MPCAEKLIQTYGTRSKAPPNMTYDNTYCQLLQQFHTDSRSDEPASFIERYQYELGGKKPITDF